MFELAQQLLTEFLDGIKQELLDYMQAEKRNATGKSAASLTVTADSHSGKLTGTSYIANVFRGRGPGGMPPINAITDWCNARGLPRAAAWAIARKIAAAGTILHRQGRNVLNEVITSEKIDKFKKDLLVIYIAEIKTDLRNRLLAA